MLIPATEVELYNRQMCEYLSQEVYDQPSIATLIINEINKKILENIDARRHIDYVEIELLAHEVHNLALANPNYRLITPLPTRVDPVYEEGECRLGRWDSDVPTSFEFNDCLKRVVANTFEKHIAPYGYSIGHIFLTSDPFFCTTGGRYLHTIKFSVTVDSGYREQLTLDLVDPNEEK